MPHSITHVGNIRIVDKTGDAIEFTNSKDDTICVVASGKGGLNRPSVLVEVPESELRALADWINNRLDKGE
jgi:hypothetical protein